MDWLVYSKSRWALVTLDWEGSGGERGHVTCVMLDETKITDSGEAILLKHIKNSVNTVEMM